MRRETGNLRERKRSMERIMAVLDQEKNYAQRLCDYANRRHCLPFKAVAFYDLESYKNFAGEHRIQLLLAEDELIAGEYDLHADCVLSLCGSDMRENCGRGLVSADREIYKYQSGEAMFRTVMQYVGASGEELRLRTSERKAQLICIYSPVNRCGKSSFALVYALSRARRERILYLSFEAFSGLSVLLGESFRTGLSDALSHLRQGSLDLAIITSLLYQCRDMDLIPPFSAEEDLLSMTGEDYAALMDTLLKETVYDAVIVDAGNLAAAAAFMEESAVVYMPVLEDTVSREKLKAFENYLRESGKDWLSEKIRKFCLPVFRMEHGAGGFIENLLLSPIGDYARRLAG